MTDALFVGVSQEMVQMMLRQTVKRSYRKSLGLNLKAENLKFSDKFSWVLITYYGPGFVSFACVPLVFKLSTEQC